MIPGYIWVISAVPFAALALWIIGAVLADRAAEAEWWHQELAWRQGGKDVVTALRRDIYARSRLR